jgi:hypothetical protein
MRRYVMTISWILAALVLLAAAAAAASGESRAPADVLYRAVVVVTGTGEQNRMTGFAQGLREVLVKLTGDPTITEDPRLADMAAGAASLVRSFSYRDRLEGKPLHDEQGTYDRPHNLTIAFDADKIDALVHRLSRTPWRGVRPKVVVVLGVDNGKAVYMLTADGTVGRSADMRESFAAAAEQIAIPLIFPARDRLEARGLDARALADMTPADALAIARESGGDAALVGRMTFSEAALGWIARWRVVHESRTQEWELRGVSFDDAFRNAMRGTAQILSAHNTPRKPQ